MFGLHAKGAIILAIILHICQCHLRCGLRAGTCDVSFIFLSILTWFYPTSSIVHDLRIGHEGPFLAGKRPLAGRYAIKPRSAPPSRGHRRPRFQGSEPCFPASCVRAATAPPEGSSSAGRAAKLLCGASCGYRMRYRRGQSMRPSGVPAGHIAASTGAVTYESGSETENPPPSVPRLRSRLRGFHGAVP